MRVAHSPLVPGGPGVSLGILAGALFIAAVYLMVKKGPPRTILLLVLVSIAIGIGAVAAPPASPDVHIAIEEPADGATVPAGEVAIRVALSGATLASSSDASSGAGHLHVLVDGEVVSMTGTLVTRVTLEPGAHTVEAEYVSADHRPLSPRVLARADVTATTGG
jgi:hypothetical protein